MPSKTQICIKIYCQPDDLSRFAAIAERMGKRRAGLLLFTAKKNGFDGEKIANTDGIGRAMKAAMLEWEGREADRLEEAAAIAREEAAIAERKKKLGVA